jgi:hypothetical protein
VVDVILFGLLRWRDCDAPFSISPWEAPRLPGADNNNPTSQAGNVLPVVSHCPDKVRELDHTDRR